MTKQSVRECVLAGVKAVRLRVCTGLLREVRLTDELGLSASHKERVVVVFIWISTY